MIRKDVNGAPMGRPTHANYTVNADAVKIIGAAVVLGVLGLFAAHG